MSLNVFNRNLLNIGSVQFQYISIIPSKMPAGKARQALWRPWFKWSIPIQCLTMNHHDYDIWKVHKCAMFPVIFEVQGSYGYPIALHIMQVLDALQVSNPGSAAPQHQISKQLTTRHAAFIVVAAGHGCIHGMLAPLGIQQLWDIQPEAWSHKVTKSLISQVMLCHWNTWWTWRLGCKISSIFWPTAWSLRISKYSFCTCVTCVEIT